MDIVRRLFGYGQHIDWYLFRPAEIPLQTDLDLCLPLPDLTNVKILWPKRYSWSYAPLYLDMIKQALASLVPVEICDVSPADAEWHRLGGFPVPAEEVHRVGTPHNPKGQNDVRGEVFAVQQGDRTIRCAYDYSDYVIVSTGMLDRVDRYFKCTVPPGALPRNVFGVGYFPSRPRVLAKARAMVLQRLPKKNIGVYVRFGTWTDSQGIRETLVARMQASPLPFSGGFGTIVFPAYLKELMRAKIALDAPGQAPITCRLPEAMALGAVVVSARPACVFPEPLQDGVHFVATQDDGSDVVEVCRELLKDEARMARIANNAMGYFDRNFSPQSVARRILRDSLQMVGRETELATSAIGLCDR
jgi:hypothetical protein